MNGKCKLIQYLLNRVYQLEHEVDKLNKLLMDANAKIAEKDNITEKTSKRRTK